MYKDIKEGLCLIFSQIHLQYERLSTHVPGVIETKHEAVKQREDITGLTGVLTEFDVNGLIQQKQDKHTLVRFISIVCIHYN